MGTTSEFVQRKMMPKRIFFWGFLLFGASIVAQEGEVINHIFEGNEQASAELFDEAEMAYRRALSKAPEKPEALYNLGNTHFQEQDFDEAKQRFFQTQKFAENKSSKHHALHNLGNVFMKLKDYAKAVETYKNALRNNPEDEETRYNYALAKELLEKEEQNQDQNDQQDQKDQQDQDNKDDNKDDNKEGDKDKDSGKEDEDKEGDEGEDEEDKKDEGDQEKDKQPEQGDSEKEQPSKPRQTELSPEQVKSLLEAMSNQEKKVQDKVNAEKVQGTPVRGQKDW